MTRHRRPYAQTIAIALLGGLAMGLCGATAWGDARTRLINIDTARILDDGQLQFGVDFRSFGGPDDGEYVSRHLRYGTHGYQLELLGSFSVPLRLAAVSDWSLVLPKPLRRRTPCSPLCVGSYRLPVC